MTIEAIHETDYRRCELGGLLRSILRRHAGRIAATAAPGCREGPRFASCPVRACCLENGFSSCAECQTPADPRDCKKFNNFVSKIFGLIFRSDRRACILQIREKGLQGHADTMAAEQRQSIRR